MTVPCSHSKKFRARLILAACFAPWLIVAAHAAESAPQYRGVDVEAMGGSGTASITGPSSMYLNPAGLAGLQGFGAEASTDAGYNPELLDYKDWAHKNSKYFSNFDSLLAHIDPGIEFPKWATASNTSLIQMHMDDFAFSVVRDARYDVTFNKVLTPELGAGMLSDLQVLAGKGFVLAPGWNMGFAFKFLYRQTLEDTLYGISDNNYLVIDSAWQRSSSIWNNVDKITVASQLHPQNQFGAGLNLGLSHSLSNGFSMGASFLDLPTFFNGGFLPPQANLGLSYAAGLGDSDAVNGRLLVNLDWQPIFTPESWFRQWKTGLSLECRAGNREIALASAGLNDGYPTFGARAGYILYAYYLYTADEGGTYPGQSRQSLQRFGVDLNF